MWHQRFDATIVVAKCHRINRNIRIRRYAVAFTSVLLLLSDTGRRAENGKKKKKRRCCRRDVRKWEGRQRKGKKKHIYGNGLPGYKYTPCLRHCRCNFLTYIFRWPRAPLTAGVRSARGQRGRGACPMRGRPAGRSLKKKRANGRPVAGVPSRRPFRRS